MDVAVAQIKQQMVSGMDDRLCSVGGALAFNGLDVGTVGVVAGAGDMRV